MNNIHIIADGGGTTTNWCVIENGERTFFSTESYHPIHWNDEFEARITKFWQEKITLSAAKISFFGAGCFVFNKRTEATAMFTRIGFKEVTVLSDLHGAAIASLGNKPGWVVIAGTGSVLFEWDGNEVQNIIGGKGHEVGDEGSGYYFGKLVLNAFQDGELSREQSEKVEEVIDLKLINSVTEKFALASMAKKLASSKDLFLAYHLENVGKLFDNILTGSDLENVTIVGGYGWHHQDIFNSISANYALNISEYLNEPIVPLVERMVGSNE